MPAVIHGRATRVAEGFLSPNPITYGASPWSAHLLPETAVTRGRNEEGRSGLQDPVSRRRNSSHEVGGVIKAPRGRRPAAWYWAQARREQTHWTFGRMVVGWRRDAVVKPRTVDRGRPQRRPSWQSNNSWGYRERWSICGPHHIRDPACQRDAACREARREDFLGVLPRSV